MTGWAPLPGLGAGARAERALADIAAALRRPPPPLDGDRASIIGLFAREPGFALFYRYLDRAAPDASARRLADRFLDRAIARVPSMSHKPFFSHGFSGTAWAVEHLRPRDAGANAEVDAALLYLVEEGPGIAFDMQYGLVGFGVYAIERIRRRAGRRLLERIVVRLGREAIRSGGGLCWQSRPYWQVGPGTPGEGDVYAGVMIGVAGVVGLAGAAIHHRVADREARHLLEGALTWLWAVREDGLFPAGAQLSWASGSLGIAAVTHAAARAAGLPRWQARALAMARRLAREPARLRDATLGEGAAGAAHMFHRLYRATGEELFARAARRWIDRLLARRRPGTGMAGFRTYNRVWQRRFLGSATLPVGWIGLPGLLNGVAGIGLVLLSEVQGLEPAWDRVLLLSHR